jgi:hypothetical protein
MATIHSYFSVITIAGTIVREGPLKLCDHNHGTDESLTKIIQKYK